MEKQGRLTSKQLKDLSAELAALSKQQSDARELEIFIRMTPQENEYYDARRNRISAIFVLLSNHDTQRNRSGLIEGTMRDYDQSQWYRLYSRAMLELEHALMTGRIMDARREILSRLEILRDMPGLHEHERQAIQEALSGLRGVEREEVRYADEQIEDAAKLALEKLRAIEPAIKLVAPSLDGDFEK